MMITLAILGVLGQGAIVWAFLTFVRSFGAYTESHKAMTETLLEAHRTNLIIHQHNLQLMDELAKTRAAKERVA